MAEDGLKRGACELEEEPAFELVNLGPSLPLAASLHPAKRRHIDQLQAQPSPLPSSNTGTTSPQITTVNGLQNSPEQHNGTPSTTSAPPLSGPSTHSLVSPVHVEVPETLDEDRLRRLEPGDLVQTILELQSTYAHNMKLVSAQYENISRQLTEIRICMSAFIKESTAVATEEAPPQTLRASPAASTSHVASVFAPQTPLPATSSKPTANSYAHLVPRKKPATPTLDPKAIRSPPVPATTPLSASARPTSSPSAEAPLARSKARTPLKLTFPADGSVPTVVTYSTLQTVEEVWAEYKHGLDGMPPIEDIEQRWGSQWRPEPKGRTWFSRRKIVLDKVRELIHDGLTEEDAVAELDAMRNGRSIHWLTELLTNDRKETKASWKAAAAAAKAAKTHS